MLVEALGDLHWLAVAAAAIAYFVLGGVWFSPPVFGNRWMAAIGWDGAGEESPGPAMYLVPLVAAVVMSVVLGLLVHATGASTVADGLELGLLTGVGLVGMVLLVTANFDPKSPKPMTWFAINLGYHGLGVLVAAVILAVWQ